MKIKYLSILGVFYFLYTSWSNKCFSQQDTLRVMTYNVLNYGDGCQGSNSLLHTYLKTIVGYTNPDLLGLNKMDAIKLNYTDNNGILPVGFADSILVNALNAAYPAKYAYCTYTNVSLNDKMCILFYNQHKLGFLSVTTLCKITTDFDLYKLYYKDPYLATTHDTTFLYAILNHTQSGSSSTTRDQQVTATIQALKAKFWHLPNLINMGDFNLHLTGEAGYQYAVAPSDTNFKFYDPPFFPEKNLQYPIDWNTTPSLCSKYLTTSTRQSVTTPNNCGSNGGAKSWYDHILLSPWIIYNTNYLAYIKESYQTIGNDGKRLSISINDSTTNGKNTSVPSSVLNALFQLSDKYPIMVQLMAGYNKTGKSLKDPDAITGVANKVIQAQETITVRNPVQSTINIRFSLNRIGEKALMSLRDLYGRLLSTEEFVIATEEIDKSVNLPPGLYFLCIQIGQNTSIHRIIKE